MRKDMHTAFTKELHLLVQKYEVHNFFAVVLEHDHTDDSTDFQVYSAVRGDPKLNLSPARIVSCQAGIVVGAMIRMLMQHCGLSLAQAYGAISETAKDAAMELQATREAFVQQATAPSNNGIEA